MRLLVVLALVASACQQATPTEPAQVADARETTAVPPTAVTPMTVTPTVPPPQPTPEASPTPRPAATPVPTPTVVPEPTPTPVGDPLARAEAISSLGPIDCPAGVVASGVTCALARLPLRVHDPDPDSMVELMIAQVDNGDPNNSGPVVFLQGGPGVGSVTNAPAFVGAQHDVLFVDQRGTGLSTPKLNCPEADELWETQYTDDAAVRLPDEEAIYEAHERCSERLSGQGISFGDFNTSAAAADIELLRRLLGHESWSLWGISYGTRLGLSIMRDYPEGVRAAVLDSVLPFEVDFFSTIPENAVRAVQALDTACDLDRCRDDHGDFFENLSSLARELDDTPIVIDVTRPVAGTTFPFRVDGSELINLVFIQLYSTRSLRSLPRQIARAEFGGIAEIVASFVARRDPDQLDLATALYYSTWCREEVPFYDAAGDDAFLAEIKAQFGSTVEDALSNDGVERFCEIFAVGAAGAVEDTPLVSDIPTLVFAGAFDPITPPAWSRQVAETLTAATYVELADHGHGMASACPSQLRIAFLINPDAALDTTCASDVVGPNFD